jgi:transcriptional regulator with XRE-family HTH domain
MTIRFGTLLRQRRREKNLSQLELASKIGVTQASVGVWERGVSAPTPENLAKLADALQMQLGQLLAADFPQDGRKDCWLRPRVFHTPRTS